MTESTSLDAELQAMSSMAKLLLELEEDSRTRVVKWAIEKLGIKIGGGGNSRAPVEMGSNTISGTAASTQTFTDLAELFDAANPNTGAEKSLVVAYWLQVCSSQEDFSSQSVNSELKNLGHGVANITAAFTDLISQKYALQIQKSGKSQQARKKYKLTRRGIQRVSELLGITGTQSNE